MADKDRVHAPKQRSYENDCLLSVYFDASRLLVGTVFVRLSKRGSPFSARADRLQGSVNDGAVSHRFHHQADSLGLLGSTVHR